MIQDFEPGTISAPSFISVVIDNRMLWAKGKMAKRLNAWKVGDPIRVFIDSETSPDRIIRCEG